MTIEIVYDELKGGEYRLLADYLRMNGFFVYNQIVKPNQALFSLNQKFDFTIVIGLDNWEGKEIVTKGFDNTICLDEEKPINDNPVSFDPNWKKRYLMNCLEVMYNNNIITDEELYVMKVTAAVYDDFDLLRTNLTLTSFYDIYNKVLMNGCYNIYDAAEMSLRDIVGRKVSFSPSGFYRLEYFTLTLERLYNEAHPALYGRNNGKKIVERINEEFGKKCDLLKLEKEGAALNLLQGLILSNERGELFHYYKYYEMAAEKLGNKAYAGYVNYLLGHYMEKSAEIPDYALEYYKIAHELIPNDCKALYRLAFMEFYYKEDYISSLMYLQQITQILENKEANNILEPKEYVKLFQTYHMLDIIYDKIWLKKKSMDMLKRRRNILELAYDCDNRNYLYDQLFGNEPFMDSGGKRMPTKMLMRERLARVKLPNKSEFR